MTENNKKTKSPVQARAERERYIIRKTLEGKYRQRFTIAKEGKLALNRRDYKMMIYRYTEYLKIMCDTFEVNSIYELKTSFFDQKKDVAEMLLISQIYWELAKVYDGSSKSKDKLELCLKQFVRFTVGMQFQGLNSEIIRKELKKRKFKNNELIRKCLEGIYKQSSGCYMATYYSSDHLLLATLRSFKINHLAKFSAGQKFIYYYYEFSPSLILFLNQHQLIKVILHLPVKFFLKVSTSLIRIFGLSL